MARRWVVVGAGGMKGVLLEWLKPIAAELAEFGGPPAKIQKLEWMSTTSSISSTKKPGVGILVHDTDTFRSCHRLLFPGDDFIVEIGCSFGMFTAQLGKLLKDPSKQYLGLDVSEKCVDDCKQRVKDLNMNVVLCDILCNWRYLERSQLRSIMDNFKNRVVFLDIGGNREFESLVALIPYIEAVLNPRLLIVKSETMYERVVNGTSTLDEQGWASLRREASRSVLERRQIPASKRNMHPFKKPLRLNDEGVPICRFHNYDQQNGCKRHREQNCPFDHEHCHGCGELGHIALECPNTNRTDHLVDLMIMEFLQQSEPDSASALCQSTE